MEIQWFPGHMAKARRLISENIGDIDIVAEIIDSRIPYSSHNEDIGPLLGAKPRILVLNKSDLADPDASAKWKKYYTDKNIDHTFVNSHDPKSIGEFKKLIKKIMAAKNQRLADKGIISRACRLIAVGIPNSGKSSFINAIASRAGAKTGDKPGVTRGKQWVNVDDQILMLDMPGVLQPKFTDKLMALHLAFTGAINDDILDTAEIAGLLLDDLRKTYPQLLSARFKLKDIESKTPAELLLECAKNRGCILQGGEPDLERISSVIIDEFRGGKIGRITLELPEIMDRQNLNETD